MSASFAAMLLYKGSSDWKVKTGRPPLPAWLDEQEKVLAARLEAFRSGF
ncbi:MAG: hypothetical protein KGL11_09675 [Alphaproteobacteria bacterium]|nr:hypothetical protein [Alphaproteobacteria bacterium]